jgi:hypothetical protein
MQITSQQYPKHRMRLPQDSRSAKRLFWRTADFLFESIAGWIFASGCAFLVDNRPQKYEAASLARASIF